MSEDSRFAFKAQPADRWVTLILLAAVYGLSSADRFLMSIFTEPIKAEFHLSDSNVGFLTGAIFAIFYVGAALPLGVLGDKWNRRNLVAACLGVFSIMTAVPGIAKGYSTLLLSRIGVGIGEAGYTPIALSLLSDKFIPAKRPGILSLFTVGGTLGAWAGITGAGILESNHNWRFAMVVFGLVGLVLAVLVLLFSRESGRGALEGISVGSERNSTISLLTTLKTCREQRSVLHTIIGITLVSLWGWGLVWWAPAFLHRSFGVSTGEAGTIIGPIHGVVGTVAVLTSAALMFWLAKGDARRPMAFVGWLGALSTLPSIAMVFAPSLSIAVVMLWLFMPMAYVSIGPALATINSGVPPHMRGQVNAIVLAISNFATLAIAPVIVGVLSDVIATHISNPSESVRYALLPLSLTGFWGAYHLWLASRSVAVDLTHVVSLAGLPPPPIAVRSQPFLVEHSGRECKQRTAE